MVNQCARCAMKSPVHRCPACDGSSSTNLQCPQCEKSELVRHHGTILLCPRCPWQRPEAEHLAWLERQTKETYLDAEIRQCMLEDKRRGDRSGGSGDKGPGKEDKLSATSIAAMKIQQHMEDGIMARHTKPLDPLEKALRLPPTCPPVSDGLLRQALGWAAQTGFIATSSRLEWEQLAWCWWDTYQDKPVKVIEVWALLPALEIGDRMKSIKALGVALRYRVGQLLHDKQLVTIKTSRPNKNLYRLVTPA